MGQVGFVIFALIAAPMACTAVVVLYLRAFRAEAAERFAVLQRSAQPHLVPVALLPAGAPMPDEPSREQTGTRRRGHGPLAARVALLLAGDHVAAGMAAPLVSAAELATFTAITRRRGARGSHAIAHLAGLIVELDALPSIAPCVLFDSTLLVRDDDNAEAMILWHAATRMLADSGTIATEADAWLLAAALAAPGQLFEAAPVSRRHG